MRFVKITIFVVMLMSLTTAYCQQDYSSVFRAWCSKIPILKSNQPVQDSSFLCLCLLCDTPRDISRHILKISCLPAGLLDINGPYCSGNFIRLGCKNVDSCVSPMLFYIEADMDYTKSLIYVSFDSMGNELSSMVLATDDERVRPLKEKTEEPSLNLFQYIIIEDDLYVRECQYNKELILNSITISVYSISHNGTIHNNPLVSGREVFDNFPPPVTKWEDF